MIKVTSEDGTSETKYYITINKKFDIAENKDLIITIIVGILVVSLIIAILVTNNKKNKKETTVVQKINQKVMQFILHIFFMFILFCLCIHNFYVYFCKSTKLA